MKFDACFTADEILVTLTESLTLPDEAQQQPLALSAPVLAADYEAGLDAARRGDWATALKEWGPLAEQGDASAQFNIGLMYARGHGVRQDYAEAVRRRASESPPAREEAA